MATQFQRSQATRKLLVDTALDLFRERGLPETTTQDILEAAGLSRGAMYHHFASRDDLVEAVYEQESAAAIDRAMRRSASAKSPVEALVASCLAWLDEVGRPAVARLLLVEGPSALGWARCREIEERHSLARMRRALEAAERAGEIELVSSELVARILNAALAEAALTLLRSPRAKRRQARADAERVLGQLVSGLENP